MYCVICNQSNGGKQYGVQSKRMEVLDITSQEADAKALVELLNRNDVSEIHLMDVIEDWFGIQ